MKKIILAAAAVALTAGAAYAQPLNYNGERKSDYASIVAAGGSTAAQGNVPLATVSLDKGFVLNSRGERSYVGQAVR